MTAAIMKSTAGAIATPIWTTEQRDLIRKTVCPPGTTDLEFEFFVTWCAQTRLNPLLKQAWLVPRKQKNPATGKYEEKMEPQVAEIGMRARADELPDYKGITGDAVFEGDEFMIDAAGGVVVHRYSLDARKKSGNKVLGAWARVEREGRRASIVYLTVESRVQTFFSDGKHVPTPFWQKDPQGQISKCARAAALRLAYPNVFANQHIAEEMREEIDVTPVAVSVQGASATDELEARLRAKLLVKPLEVKPLELTPHAKIEEPAPAPAESKTESKATPPARNVHPIERLRFGPSKGSIIADCSTLELEEALEIARKAIADAGANRPGWYASTLEGIQAVEIEIAKRETPEPGAEG